MRVLPLSAAVLFSAASTLASTAAGAHGGGAAMPAEVPAAPPGSDGAAAEKVIHELEAKGAGNAEAARVVAEPLKNAKRALERAHGARTSGDQAHARMLDGLALEWAETARELDRAAAAEQVALAIGKRAHDVSTKADRARALLEETQARRGRAAAELEKVQADARDAQKGAADAEAHRLDAAKKKAGAKPAPPKAPPPAPPRAPAKKGAK